MRRVAVASNKTVANQQAKLWWHFNIWSLQRPCHLIICAFIFLLSPKAIRHAQSSKKPCSFVSKALSCPGIPQRQHSAEHQKQLKTKEMSFVRFVLIKKIRLVASAERRRAGQKSCVLRRSLKEFQKPAHSRSGPLRMSFASG